MVYIRGGRTSLPFFPIVLLCFTLSIHSLLQLTNAASVTYDHRALVIDGKRKILISASIHYPRSTPEMWPDLIAKAKEGGVDVIETYVFWNSHEPIQGTYNFEGRLDLVRFLREVQQAGLYVNLRIGPYVCAEWNYGGFPVWLHYLPGIKFRTENEPFKNEMQKFTTKIVDMMKGNQLFYWQGGPIILAQIENEYGNVDSHYGKRGKKYMHWAAEMAVGLNTGVPWIMCQQHDAPDPIINTCNGFYCDNFTPNSHKKPKIWTENWSGWFQAFGGALPHRPVEDVAYAVARFYEKGGTFQNYYMYHGGTNFGRTAGGPFVATSYDYDAPIDEYGIVSEPKWGHLKELHQAIKLCEPALILEDPIEVSLGVHQQGHIYTNKKGICAAFLANLDDRQNATVYFRGQAYNLPAWSVSILPDCKNEIFNTAKVNTQTSLKVMKPEKPNSILSSTNVSGPADGSFSGALWGSFEDSTGIWERAIFTVNGFVDHINTTRDTTDYLWYTTSVNVDEGDLFSGDNRRPSLAIKSSGHAMDFFVNGKFSGSSYGRADSPEFQLEIPIDLKPGRNEISCLSMTVGLQNYGPFFEISGAGIKPPIAIEGLRDGRRDLSSQTWTYQIGLKGESLNLHTQNGGANVEWASSTEPPQYKPLTWYQTTFDAPKGNNPVALDLKSMGKGQVWVNGESLGRYWPRYFSSDDSCSTPCDYRGPYDPSKCATNCGEPSQRWYHVPRSWLKPAGNFLVLFEEIGGDPTAISLVTRSVSTICAHIRESHFPPVDTWNTSKLEQYKQARPEIRLECRSGQKLSSIDFASYGNPQGSCGNFRRGSCHDLSSLAVLRKACIGHERCSLSLSQKHFTKDPCPHIEKSLAVAATCSH